MRQPQTSISACLRETMLRKFCRVAFPKTICGSLEELQRDSDDWIVGCTHEPSPQAKWRQGRTPLRVFLDGKVLVREKMLA